MTGKRGWEWLSAGLSVLLMLVALGCQQGEQAAPVADEEPADAQAETGDETATDDEAAGDEAAAEDEADEEAPADETADDQAAADEQLPEVPLGLPPVPVPDDNPMTAAKVELGKLLYFDKRLSKDGTLSCATCHDPQMAWTEHRATSEGIGGQLGERNSPTVINSAYHPEQFWDGRAASLEEQALGPVANPIEMGHTVDAMVQDLSKLDGYNEHFQKAFGTGVTADGVAKAIAAFERTVLSGNSPYDKFQAGDEAALTDEQKEGWQLFQDAGCVTCHSPPLFTNGRYYNAGIGMDKEEPDVGRMAVTEKEGDKGKFRVPTLREIANTHPYFHDGSAETLEDAVALMAAGGKDNENLSAMLKAVREAELTEEDQKKIVAFLNGLSGEYPIVEPPELPE
jgi:cytochrome c peroxidase